MKLVIEIKPLEDAPSNWRLTVLKKLEKFMKTLDVKDYHIGINGYDPYIIRWADP